MKKSDLQKKRTRAGLGLYTTIRIKKGVRVIEYTGEKISTEEADRRGGRYLFIVNKKQCVDGRRRENISRYINHSCKPNCYPEINYAETRIFIFAKRAIAPGEELTYDYGKEYAKEYCSPCRCDACYAKSQN